MATFVPIRPRFVRGASKCIRHPLTAQTNDNVPPQRCRDRERPFRAAVPTRRYTSRAMPMESCVSLRHRHGRKGQSCTKSLYFSKAHFRDPPSGPLPPDRDATTDRARMAISARAPACALPHPSRCPSGPTLVRSGIRDRARGRGCGLRCAVASRVACPRGASEKHSLAPRST